MKKKLIFLCLSLTMCLAPLNSFAAMIGTNYATLNTNIRISADASAERIGYFKKGQRVMVKKILGKWCQVQYKNYLNAYVYCPLLKAGKNSLPSQPSNIKPLSFNDVSLDYSNDWQIDTSLGLKNSLVLQKKSSKISIIRCDFSNPVNAQNEAKGFINMFTSIGNLDNPSKFTIVSKEDILIPIGKDSFPTKIIVLQAPSPDNESTINFMLTAVAKENYVYIVTGNGGLNETDVGEMEKIIKTFKVK